MTTIKSHSTPELSQDERIQWNTMVGKWYGKTSLSEGGIYEWVMDRNSNGEYHQSVKITSDGKTTENLNIGTWGICGDVYFSICKTVEYPNGGIYIYPSNDPRNYNAFYVLSLSKTEFEYKHTRTETVFKVKKIDDDFEI